MSQAQATPLFMMCLHVIFCKSCKHWQMCFVSLPVSFCFCCYSPPTDLTTLWGLQTLNWSWWCFLLEGANVECTRAPRKAKWQARSSSQALWFSPCFGQASGFACLYFHNFQSTPRHDEKPERAHTQHSILKTLRLTQGNPNTQNSFDVP